MSQITAAKILKHDCRVVECCLGLSSSWIDPSNNYIFIQARIPELAELSMYYMNLVSPSCLERTPTVKSRDYQKGFLEIRTGFLSTAQAVDITAFKVMFL